MPPKRTVSFHPSTNPAAESNHVPIVPGTEIYLRDCQTWIPVQVLDMILIRLLVTSSSDPANPVDYNLPSYHNPPYRDLLYDLSFITSFPVTSEMISEVEEMRLGRPFFPANSTALQLKQWVLWQDFDKMHEKWINLQRQRVEESEEGRRLAKKNAARLPLPITSASKRAKLNLAALRQARCRAILLNREAEQMWDVVQKIAVGEDADEDDGERARKRRFIDLPVTSLFLLN